MVEVERGLRVSRMHKMNDTGSLKALCDVMIEDAWVVRGVRVVEGKKGIFVGMPRRQGGDGKWYDTAFPIRQDVRGELQEKVLTAYQSTDSQ